MDIIDRLDLNVNVTTSALVLVATQQFEFMVLFLENIFANIIFFLVLLSIALIYSLMVGDVDSKTYEMGMLRALGLR